MQEGQHREARVRRGRRTETLTRLGRRARPFGTVNRGGGLLERERQPAQLRLAGGCPGGRVSGQAYQAPRLQTTPPTQRRDLVLRQRLPTAAEEDEHHLRTPPPGSRAHALQLGAHVGARSLRQHQLPAHKQAGNGGAALQVLGQPVGAQQAGHSGLPSRRLRPSLARREELRGSVGGGDAQRVERRPVLAEQVGAYRLVHLRALHQRNKACSRPLPALHGALTATLPGNYTLNSF